MKKLLVQDILTEKIHLPAEFEREELREDTQLRASIKASGVEQPLVVLASEGVYKVIEGGRRLRIAKELGIAKLPCVVETLPEGQDELPFMRKLRFRLDEHRQDLLPSQRAKLVEGIKDSHGFTNAQVAAYLGVTPDTITNWTDILKYPAEVQQAMDAGKVKAHIARPLRNLKPEAQLSLFLKHADEFSDSRKAKVIERRFKHEYSPEKAPDLYLRPAVSAAIRARPRPKKAPRHTKNYSHEEKRKLVNDLELQNLEVEENKRELATLKAKNAACIPVVAVMLRNRKVKELIDGETVVELQAWGERYLD